MAILKFSPVQRKKCYVKAYIYNKKIQFKNNFNLDDRIYKIIYRSPEKDILWLEMEGWIVEPSEQ